LGPTLAVLSAPVALGRTVAVTLNAPVALGRTVAVTLGAPITLIATAVLATTVALPPTGIAVARRTATTCTVAIASTAIIGKLPQAIAAVIGALRRTVAPAVEALLLAASSTNVVAIGRAIPNFTLIVASNKRATRVAGGVMVG
jgi:hypothetical protein